MEDEERLSGSSEFGILLRRYRIASGLSQEALAERARMSSDGISALERGHRRTPQRETLALLAGALTLDDEQRREFEAAARSSVPRGPGGASVTVGPWAPGGTATLPLALTSFVGRDTELGDISTLVRERRLVTLTGAGGVGKTQTALRVATALRDGETRAVCFVGLAPLTDTSLVASAVASSVGVQEVPNRPLLDTLIAYLKDKALLLLLDNCEHVITEAANVAGSLLHSCPKVRILATSREPLRAAGEHAYRLPSLSVASAVELFTERARAVNYRFGLADDNSPSVGEICRCLDGIPLAIELAAARVNSLPITAIAQRLDDRFRILTGGDRTALPRQQTMRATIDWSYDLLSEQEKRVFERLSVFAGGCTLDTAIHVCANDGVAEADVLALIASLVDKSLVTVDFERSEPRYKLLESFRDYAREKLAAKGDYDAVAYRHALAFLKLAERFDRAICFESDEARAGYVSAEPDNWRAALQWALTGRADTLCGLRLAGPVARLWADVMPEEAGRLIETALRLVDEETPTEVAANLQLAACIVALCLGEHRKAYASGMHAIELYQPGEDAVALLRAKHYTAISLVNLRQAAEAKRLLHEVSPLARALQCGRIEGHALRQLGEVSILEGERVTARSYFEQARAVFGAAGCNAVGATVLVTHISLLKFLAGDVNGALQDGLDGISELRELGWRGGMLTTALCQVGAYLVELGRYEEAKSEALEALAEGGKDHPWLVCLVLLVLVAISTRRPVTTDNDAADKNLEATRVMGFVKAQYAALECTPELFEQQQYDRIMSFLHETLGSDKVNHIMELGSALTQEEAIELALRL